MSAPYCGRFAPSPTGPLHAGSITAALASWLDARAHHGRWLVRIEDIDPARCAPGADRFILQQLAQLGLHPDAPPVWQSRRHALYEQALAVLLDQGWAYPCGCTRKDLEQAWQSQGRVHQRHQERPYPGICRSGLHGKSPRSWRFHLEKFIKNWPSRQIQTTQTAPFFLDADGLLHWHDRRQGWQTQRPAEVSGDFVVRRADGLWAYQLAVVVDDADQGITQIVRGADLSDNTPRQLLLQSALGYPTPGYLHTPLVTMANGEKLSKQHGAPAADTGNAMATLLAAASFLGLPPPPGDLSQLCPGDALNHWVNAWHSTYNRQVTENQFPPSPATPGAAPAHVAHPQTIRSFVRRTGRVTTGQAKAFAELGAAFVLPYKAAPLDATAAFGRTAPLILEIGFGMGEATAHIAQVRPDDNFLCCEVHEPGVGALLKRIGEQGIGNIRILQHDAVEVIEHMLPPASLDGIHVFFPDPWHKKKHNKRRLIQAPFLAKLASRLAQGGYIHCATDWQPYAEQMLEVLSAEPQLTNGADGFAPRPHYRPTTKFEKRGLRLGHGVWDLVFRKR